jgi:hypothetical protein
MAPKTYTMWVGDYLESYPRTPESVCLEMIKGVEITNIKEGTNTLGGAVVSVWYRGLPDAHDGYGEFGDEYLLVFADD